MYKKLIFSGVQPTGEIHIGNYLGAISQFVVNQDKYESIIESCKSRLRPVLLTAITTILSLVPLSIGFNINFFTLFSDFNPNIYWGGDNFVFWGPLATTVISGLFVATFLTLFVVPSLFLIIEKFKLWIGVRYT